MLRFASLNSGSNGNCFYIGTAREAVLVDCGISNREVVRRMKRLKLPMSNIKGVFITHEHNDHVVGAATVSKKHNLPIYLSPPTRKLYTFGVAEERIRTFESHVPVQFDQLQVIGVPRTHDAVDAHSFIVKCGSISVGVFTDLGHADETTIRYFKQCHAAFLEANYDEDMLTYGSYPPALKARIRGDAGHLSNLQALQLVNEHRPQHMEHLVLSHLSRNNNRESIVKNLFEPWAKQMTITIATRRKETALFQIGSDGSQQLTLF